MFRRNLTALLFLCTFSFVFSTTNAQDSVKAASSQITLSSMPKGAERLLQEKVPTEFNQVFEKLLAEGEGKITGGEREVLAWEGNYKNKSNSAKFKGEIQTNFRKEGWQYESAESRDDMEFFSLFKEGSPRRVVLGFFVATDELIVCALTEVKKTEEIVSGTGKNDQPNSTSGKNDPSIYGKWFRTVGGSTIDWTGKTTLKGGEDFTFEFFADGSVEYTRKKEVLNFMQCHIKESQNAHGKFSISGSTLTINLGAMKSVGSNSCDAKGNFNKTLSNSTMTAQIQIKQMDDITRPDKPLIMCFDGNEVCYEKQK